MEFRQDDEQVVSPGSNMVNHDGSGPSREICRDSSAVPRLPPTSSTLRLVHHLNRVPGETDLLLSP